MLISGSSISRLGIPVGPLIAIAFSFAAPVAVVDAADAPSASRSGEEGWKLVTQSGGITIYNRPKKDSGIEEIKAVGVIDARPVVIKRVLDDTDEYPHFMPYVTESRIIAREGASLIGYQRLSPPLVSDRDYTMRIRYETRETADGMCYCNRWEAANDLGPAEKKGVARVKVNQGYWLLEPTAGGRQTRATYCVYSDSGGSIPAALINAANRTAIPKLFECVGKQAKLERYNAQK
jgi:hypothetical protein